MGVFSAGVYMLCFFKTLSPFFYRKMEGGEKMRSDGGKRSIYGSFQKRSYTS